jgi:dienelactone hydrolase
MATGLVEDGRPVRLEVVIFKPPGQGPFPLAVINHGSTGRGNDPALFTQTWSAADLADFLNERGWIVAFPQRRGRGKSDGHYDEGFSPERAKGYTCDSDISLAGADRALHDIDAALTSLKRRSDVAASQILIGGQSRGGVLSIAYSGAHPQQIFGVLNWAGGWLGDSCATATDVNQTLFKQGARFKRPTLWLYGQHDPFYSIAHSRENFSAFQKAGGQGSFLEFDVPGGYGHAVINHPQQWSGPAGTYLDSLAANERHG